MKGAQAMPRGLDTFDYNLDIPDHEARAASDLGSHGIKLAYIKGDVCTTAMATLTICCPLSAVRALRQPSRLALPRRSFRDPSVF